MLPGRMLPVLQLFASMEPLSGESGMQSRTQTVIFLMYASMEPLSGESGMSGASRSQRAELLRFNGATLRREWNVRIRTSNPVSTFFASMEPLSGESGM